jgi:hypothetical protein
MMRGFNKTSDYRWARAQSPALIGLVLTSTAYLVAALIFAHTALIGSWPGLGRIGVPGLGSPESPIRLAPFDEVPTSPSGGSGETPSTAAANSTTPSEPIDPNGQPGNHTNPPAGGDDGPGDGTQDPDDGDPPPGGEPPGDPTDPVGDTLLARVDSSVPSGAIQLQSFGATGTAVMALSLAAPEPPATCPSEGSGRVVVPIRSSDESVATVAPENLSFDCIDSEVITIRPAAPGVATIVLGRPTTVPEDTKVQTGGASFEVEVTQAPPPNTEPTVRVPLPVTIEADAEAGTTFAWRAEGSDPEEGDLPATCTPAPGSLFPIGTTSVTCAVTDSGGLTDSATFDVTVTDGPVDDPDPGDGGVDPGLPDVDKPYAPSVSLPPAPFVDERGQWFRDRVLVRVTDNGDRLPLDGTPSGVDRRSFPHVILVNEAGWQTVSGITVKDRAGNESNPAPEIGFNIDRAAPIVGVTCPSAPVALGEQAAATWTASDEGSGLATKAAGAVELDTDQAGTFSVAVPAGSAIDNVGHPSVAVACDYEVVAPEIESEPVLDTTARSDEAEAATSSEAEAVAPPASEYAGHTAVETAGEAPAPEEPTELPADDGMLEGARAEETVEPEPATDEADGDASGSLSAPPLTTDENEGASGS